MNHKRHRTKNQRAGCLECKPQKANGYGEMEQAKASDRRRMVAARRELTDAPSDRST